MNLKKYCIILLKHCSSSPRDDSVGCKRMLSMNACKADPMAALSAAVLSRSITKVSCLGSVMQTISFQFVSAKLSLYYHFRVLHNNFL